MRVLFVARHFMYFRNFESVIELLAERSHDVHLLADEEEALGGRALVERMAAKYDGVSFGLTPPPDDEAMSALAAMLRLGIDAFRFTDPRYLDTPMIKDRAFERTPCFALSMLGMPGSQLGVHVLSAIERAVPRRTELDRYIAELRPDVVLVTPLIGVGSEQLDHLRSARAAGIPTALCVWSWDHLSSKALLRDLPDRLLVWNETQRDEAISMHHVSADRVIVTGAQCFDKWFDRAPSRSQAEFCQSVGLSDDRPFFLYVCSALFKGSPSEPLFVRKWVEAVRQSSDPRVRDAGVLVRPHPQRMYEWNDVGVSDLPNVAFSGANPLTRDAKNDYFDALHHCAGVVGLNTSALVEASIADHPVHTILVPEFRGSQDGTLHFHYLMSAGGGMLHVATGLDAHLSQLGATLRRETRNKNRAFVEAFIRPRGRGTAATPVFVEAVEDLGAGGLVAQVGQPGWAPLLRPAVVGLRILSDAEWGAPLLMDPAKAGKHRARAARVRQKEKGRRVKARAKRRRLVEQRVRLVRHRAAKAVRRVLYVGHEAHAYLAARRQKAARRMVKEAAKRGRIAAKRRARRSTLVKAAIRRVFGEGERDGSGL